MPDEVFEALDRHYRMLNEIYALNEGEDELIHGDDTIPADQDFIDWVNGLTE